MAGHIGIPARFLAIFQEEILLGLRRFDKHRLIVGVERIERVGAGGINYCGLEEAERIAVVGRIAYRGAAIVVVTATRHNVPDARVVGLSAGLFIVGVVEVGQSEHV